jgi:hypothetical protein
MFTAARRSIAMIPSIVKTGHSSLGHLKSPVETVAEYSSIVNVMADGVTTVAGGVVTGVSTVTGGVVTGVTTVAGGVVSGVNTVTGFIGDAKDQVIATGVLQNVNTLNAIKKSLRQRKETDPITIAMAVNLGVANVTLTTVFNPNSRVEE